MKISEEISDKNIYHKFSNFVKELVTKNSITKLKKKIRHKFSNFVIELVTKKNHH